MGTIHQPQPVKLFVGMLSPDRGLFDACAGMLSREYGPTDLRSEPASWEFTGYYRREMGGGIERQFVFFERLADPGVLPALKRLTNRLEEQFSIERDGVARRRINIDPGYLTEAKVVLATAKDYAHRIYIGEGTYAEVTLRYRRDRFLPLDTTYPDYRMEETRKTFDRARDLLHSVLRG